MGLEYITQPQVFTATVCAVDFRATNLLSTNLTSVPSLSVSNLNSNTVTVSSVIINSNSVSPKTTFNNLVSALGITVNGRTVFLPLLSAI